MTYYVSRETRGGQPAMFVVGEPREGNLYAALLFVRERITLDTVTLVDPTGSSITIRVPDDAKNLTGDASAGDRTLEAA